MLGAVYQTLCQCVGVCDATFSGDKNLPNTCQNNYRSHFGMACMTHINSARGACSVHLW